MKRALIVIIGTLIIVTGLFFILNSYIYKQKQGDEVPASASSTFSGTIASIDMTAVMVDGPAIVNVTTEQGDTKTVAVPSMGIRTCAAAANITEVSALAVGDRVEVSGDVTETGQVVPCVSPDHYLRAETTYQNASVGVEFVYRKGPNGYMLLEPEDGLTENETFVDTFVLMLRDEYNALVASPEGREAPPAITVSVYTNAENAFATTWAEETPDANSTMKIGDSREVTVGGANAVRYLVDGLYPTDTVVVAHGGFMYLITGAYLEESDVIRSDFEAFLEQLAFVPIATSTDSGTESTQ